MKLKKIILNNIRSYEKEEVNFSEGSTLLSGDIGSGKTSILLGIEFALFGLQPGQRGSILLKNGTNEGGVVLELEIEGKEIIIERNLKRGKSISQDYCAITIDKEKEEISVTELKSRVLELLNYPKDFVKKQNLLYKFTVYTPQEEMKQIILQDSDTRINTLRHVFGIDKYKKVLENVAIITSKIREEKRLKEGATLNLEQDKTEIISKEEGLNIKNLSKVSIERDLVSKKRIRQEVEEEIKEVSKKRNEKVILQQEVEKTKIMISHKKETIIENSKLTTRLKEEIEVFQKMDFNENEIYDTEQWILMKKKEKAKLNEISFEINSQINSIKLKNEELLSLDKKISNLDICPTCLQNVDTIYRTNVLNKSRSDISVNNKKLEQLEQEKKEIFNRINSFDLEIDSKNKRLTDLKILKMKKEGIYEKQKRLEEINKSNSLLEKDIDILMRHNETLKYTVFELSKFDNLYQEKQMKLDIALREEKIVEIKIAELRKEIEVFSIQIEELKEKVKNIERIKEELNYLITLENWLSKKFAPMISFIEKNVMIRLKSEFSKLFGKWFCMLVSDSFNARLTDDFTPIIEQQDYEIDYAYLSGGERTAVALAYRLALNQVINSVLSKIKTKDLVILDEPTDGFSDQQLDKMREVLEQLDVKQLIIVSHEQKMEGFVGNVIRFKKNNGISSREENI